MITTRNPLTTLALCCCMLLLAALPMGASATSLRIEVNGLVCSFCADGILHAFGKQAAVKDVFVSLEDRLVAVQLKDGQALSDEIARQLLTDAGYTVVRIERTEATLAEIRAEADRD